MITLMGREEQIIDIVKRDTADLKTRREKEAFAAGMRAAAKICDVVAEKVRDHNPGRGKGKVSSVGEFGAGIAEMCGDEIIDQCPQITDENRS